MLYIINGALQRLRNWSGSLDILMLTNQSTLSNPYDNDNIILFGIRMGNNNDRTTHILNILENPKGHKKITRWSYPEFLKNGIVGMICLDKDYMIVLDRTSCSVILINIHGNPISSYGFKCLPWAMILYDNNSVAVSIPGENKIIFVAVEFNDFAYKKEINCSVEPSGITGGHGVIYITSYPWSSKAAVSKLSEDGNVDTKLDKDQSNQPLFKAPLDIVLDKESGDIFVCDSGLKMVLAFDMNLQEKFRINLEDMKHPSCLTLDSQGDVFICDKLLNVIYKITTAEQTGRVVFTVVDGLSRPQAICNIPSENALCVLCAKDNVFRILKVSLLLFSLINTSHFKGGARIIV